MSTKVLNGFDMQNTTIDNLPNAVSAQQPATKAQLDAAVQGFSWKASVRAASAGTSTTLSGLQTVDGVSLIAGDRFLEKDHSPASANGLYVVGSGAWVRATDADTAAEILSMAVLVQEGTVNDNRQYVLSTNAPITLGATALTFVQIGGGTSYTQGNGITISGNTISLDPAVAARKAGANIGNGSATSFNINHGLNTTDYAVFIKETGSGKQQVLADISEVDANNITVTFAVAPTTNQYRITVIG